MAGNLIFHDGVAESLMYTQSHVQSGRSMLAGPRPLRFMRASSIRSHRRHAQEEEGGCTRSHPRSVQVRSSQSTIEVSSVVFRHLLDVVLALEVLALDELGDLIVVVTTLLALAALLEALVALGELAEGSEGVGAELVKDAGDELGELLVLAVAVDGEGVGRHSGVDCAALV